MPQDKPGLALTAMGRGSAYKPFGRAREPAMEAPRNGRRPVHDRSEQRTAEPAEHPKAKGHAVTVVKASRSSAQRWTITPSGDGFYDLTPQSDPLATLADGSPVSIEIDTGAASQALETGAPPEYGRKRSLTGYALDRKSPHCARDGPPPLTPTAMTPRR